MFRKKEDDTTETCRLVTLFDSEDVHFKNRRDWRVVELPHPSTGDMMNFGVVTTTTQEQHIYEIQSISTKYGSYFIGSLVLKNGDLHVATRVDPLWFVLESLSSSSSSSDRSRKQWQPYDQLNMKEKLQSILSSSKSSRSQLENLCRVNTQLGTEEDMLLYRLDEERVLQWLTHKQKRSHKVVLAEFMKDKESSSKTSSKSQGFNLLEDDDTTTNPVTTNPTNNNKTTTQQLALTPLEQTRIQQHSIQIVCEYLSPSWRKKFLQHLGEDEETCLQIGKKKVVGNSSDGDNNKKRSIIEEEMLELTGLQSAQKKPKPTPQSVGQKRLQKVSKKGMKPLSSFFGAKPKK